MNIEEYMRNVEENVERLGDSVTAAVTLMRNDERTTVNIEGHGGDLCKLFANVFHDSPDIAQVATMALMMVQGFEELQKAEECSE